MSIWRHRFAKALLVASSLWMLICLACADSALAQTAPSAQPRVGQKNILLLYSYGHGGAGVAMFDDGLVSTLNAGGIGPSNLFFEYLDLERNKADKGYTARTQEFLLRKYADRTIDLILTVQQPARDFLLREGGSIAPRAPVVSVQAAPISEAESGDRRFVSLLARFDIKGTLERAVELFPRTERVVFVSGSSNADRDMAAQAADVAASWQGKLAFEYTGDVSLKDMLRRVASLPPRTIIIFLMYNTDSAGNVVLAYEVEAMIVKVANAPVFGLYDFNLHDGGIGGSVVSVKGLGEKVGHVALDLLQGRLQPTRPVTTIDTETVPMFDWRQIERWGGDASRLPSHTVFINRKSTMWEEHAAYILWAAALIVAQSVLIASLIVNKRRRTRAEKSLHESESRYRNLVETTKELVTSVDVEGRFTFVNQTAQDYLGLAPEACIGLSAFDFVHPDDREATKKAFADWSNSGELALRFENRQLSRGGEVHLMQWSIVKVLANSGRLLGFRGIARDVTQEHLTADALRKSEERHRAIVQSAIDGFWLTDTQGMLLEVNETYCRMSGYGMQELLAMRITDLEAVETADDSAARMRRIVACGEDRFESRHRRKDGTIFDAEISVKYQTMEGGRCAVFIKDISERKRTEEALRAAEEQFRGLAEQSIAGICLFQDGKLIYVNQRFAEIIDQGPADELIGTDPLLWVAEADRGRVAENMRRLLDGETRNAAYDLGVLRRDGVAIQIGANAARATHKGRPAIIGMVQDISEKTRAEGEIRRYLEQLKTAFMSTVEVATIISEMRDPYTAGHERRVAEIAVAIGTELGLDAHRQEGLQVAGHLHDIGKITIPIEILAKPGKLSAIEFRLIQGHAQASYDVLKGVEFPWPVAQVALQHHERMDGSGYPQGLKGEAILLEARIIAVADVVEAMSSHRPYRPALGIEKALAEIERGSGTAYDPMVADACVILFRTERYRLPA